MARGYRGQPSRDRAETASSKGLLLCSCWCEKNYVWITKEDLAFGITFSCGLKKCKDPTTKRTTTWPVDGEGELR